jgi:hypothetical protein
LLAVAAFEVCLPREVGQARLPTRTTGSNIRSLAWAWSPPWLGALQPGTATCLLLRVEERPAETEPRHIAVSREFSSGAEEEGSEPSMDQSGHNSFETAAVFPRRSSSPVRATRRSRRHSRASVAIRARRRDPLYPARRGGGPARDRRALRPVLADESRAGLEALTESPSLLGRSEPDRRSRPRRFLTSSSRSRSSSQRTSRNDEDSDRRDED